MKLWLLEARGDLPTGVRGIEGGNPWEPWYDKAFGFVVRAATEEDARQIATGSPGDEVRAFKDAWLNPKYSTCVELSAEGEAGAILQDYRSA